MNVLGELSWLDGDLHLYLSLHCTVPVSVLYCTALYCTVPYSDFTTHLSINAVERWMG